jgi:hypothetical protein
MAGPSVPTIKRLFAVSGNTCAFPNCTQPLIDNSIVIGEMAHIKGEKPHAARYDSNQTDAERHGFDNIILMCPSHHTRIDKDEQTYPVEKLKRMKQEHESRQTSQFSVTDHEAMRLAIAAAGGTALGATAVTAEFARSLSHVLPSPVSRVHTGWAQGLPPGHLFHSVLGRDAQAVGRSVLAECQGAKWETIDVTKSPGRYRELDELIARERAKSNDKSDRQHLYLCMFHPDREITWHFDYMVHCAFENRGLTQDRASRDPNGRVLNQRWNGSSTTVDVLIAWFARHPLEYRLNHSRR